MTSRRSGRVSRGERRRGGSSSTGCVNAQEGLTRRRRPVACHGCVLWVGRRQPPPLLGRQRRYGHARRPRRRLRRWRGTTGAAGGGGAVAAHRHKRGTRRRWRAGSTCTNDSQAQKKPSAPTHDSQPRRSSHRLGQSPESQRYRLRSATAPHGPVKHAGHPSASQKGTLANRRQDGSLPLFPINVQESSGGSAAEAVAPSLPHPRGVPPATDRRRRGGGTDAPDEGVAGVGAPARAIRPGTTGGGRGGVDATR